jgi:hypothetical protein
LHVSLSNTGKSYEIILRQDVLIAVQTLEAEMEQYFLSCIIVPFRTHFEYSSAYDLEHGAIQMHMQLSMLPSTIRANNRAHYRSMKRKVRNSVMVYLRATTT